MDSRIPKLKLFKQSTTLIDINVKSNYGTMVKSQNNLSHSVNSTKLKVDTKEHENMLSNDKKSNNENKFPLQVSTQTKSTPMISKSNDTIKAVKRAGTTVKEAIEIKKSKIKVNVNTINPRRSLKGTLKTRTVMNKPIVNNTNKQTASTTTTTTTTITTTVTATTTTTTTVNKWDYKSRFAIANSELNKLHGSYKEITAKNKEFQDLIEFLKHNENMYKLKAEECELLNTTLATEVKTLTEELRKIQDEKKNLEDCWKKSKEEFLNVTEELMEFQNKYAKQQAKIQEQANEILEFKTNLVHNEKLIQDLTSQKEELQTFVHQMDKDRRILRNTIQEMKGNIRVFCRIRPRISKEASKPQCVIRFVDECTIEIGKSDGLDNTCCSGKPRALRQEFSFDKVFSHNASQSDIFEELSLLVQSALEGYNVCIFAYGQTGSGKTYTMEGEPGPDTEGMIPRTVQHIFKEMTVFKLLGWEYQIEASFLEIYNEHIVDLLDSQCNKIHEIRMKDYRGHDLYVSNLKVEEIHNAEELYDCLLIAQRNRAVAATKSNERSSRSHSIACIRIIGKHNGKQEICIGNLNLVDLAGSERLKDEEAARTAETKNINKSLANLGNVILALLKKQEHVPYRNSKLTHLLMPSLGGNSKTLMLLNISPLDECYNETLNSLRFASNVNNCKVNVRRAKTSLSNTSNMVISPKSTLEI